MGKNLWEIIVCELKLANSIWVVGNLIFAWKVIECLNKLTQVNWMSWRLHFNQTLMSFSSLYKIHYTKYIGATERNREVGGTWKFWADEDVISIRFWKPVMWSSCHLTTTHCPLPVFNTWCFIAPKMYLHCHTKKSLFMSQFVFYTLNKTIT